MHADDVEHLNSCIRVVPDWPQPGVMFKDLTGLMADARAFRIVIDSFAELVSGGRVDVVAGIEARGFPYGAALAHHLGTGFVTLRKPGKLPGLVHAREYELEYGTATLELHQDAIGPGSRVVIVDDVLATGGTAGAAIELVRRCDAEVAAFLVIMDLAFLGGSSALRASGAPVHSLLTE